MKHIKTFEDFVSESIKITNEAKKELQFFLVINGFTFVTMGGPKFTLPRKAKIEVTDTNNKITSFKLIKGKLDGHSASKESEFEVTTKDFNDYLKSGDIHHIDESMVSENITPNQMEQVAKKIAHSMANHTKSRNDDGIFTDYQIMAAFKYIHGSTSINPEDKKKIVKMVQDIISESSINEKEKFYTSRGYISNLEQAWKKPADAFLDIKTFLNDVQKAEDTYGLKKFWIQEIKKAIS